MKRKGAGKTAELISTAYLVSMKTPEFNLPNSSFFKSINQQKQALCHRGAIPTLGRQKQANTWGKLGLCKVANLAYLVSSRMKEKVEGV